MKKLLFIIALLLSTYGNAQDIDKLEYFTDSDPGFGQGTPILLTPSTGQDVSFNIDTQGLISGLHYVFVRAGDVAGKWSMLFATPFYIVQADISEVSRMEYFFNTDPGFGNGKEVPITQSKGLNVTFSPDISTLSIGLHRLYTRAQNTEGNWSHTFVDILYITEPLPAMVTQFEYFCDVDPGYGLGEQVPVNPGNNVNAIFQINTGNLQSGLHRIYMRAKNSSGSWSVTHIDVFYKSEILPLDITGLEYFIDTDPGFGNAINVPVSPGKDISAAIPINISAMGAGRHTFCLRARNSAGKWSVLNWDIFILLELKAMLQGPYNPATGLMSLNLNLQNKIPLNQPFNTNSSAVWYYAGNENVANIPSGNIVDWVLVQIRQASSSGGANRSTIVETRPAFFNERWNYCRT